jgi:putative DNA primase/helicase
MSVPTELVEQARQVAIEDVVAARAVKLRRVGRELVGACVVCGGDDRFAVDPKRAIWNCRGCGKGGDVIALQQHIDGSSFADAVRALTVGERSASIRRTPPPASKPKSDDTYLKQQARKAAWLWSQRQPLAGSIGERYLREARGYGGRLPPTLGFLPAREDRHPAMVAAFAMAPETEPTVLGEPSDVASVHLTLLKADGSSKVDTKPNKIIVGSPASRPIVLAPINDLLGLAITEGIEDGLSVAWALGIGAWAAGAAGFMSPLAGVVPSYVEAVTIYAHRDPAGERGAGSLGDRLVARGIEVFLEGV